MKNTLLLLLRLLWFNGSYWEKNNWDHCYPRLASIRNKSRGCEKSQYPASRIEELNQAIGEIDKEQSSLVTSINAASAPYAHYVSFQGTLETDRNIATYPEIPALLKKVAVKEGQRVKKGQVLAVLLDSGMIDQLQQLEIQYALAKLLSSVKSVCGSKNWFWMQSAIRNSIQKFEKSIAQMQDQVAKTITAPDGIVDHIMADEGSSLAPGMTSGVINLDQMKERFNSRSSPTQILPIQVKGNPF